MSVRTDRATDPGVLADLADARLGQASFSRALNEVRNDRLATPSALPGWSRAHVIAHVGYNARGINRLVDWAGTGIETPMYPDPAARAAEIALGATLSGRALRHLSDHAAIALDVAWRDLPADRWTHPVRTALGRIVPVSETVWMRTRETWLHAVDLDTGARLVDIPARVASRLLTDVLTTWSSRDADGREVRFVLEATDSGEIFAAADAAASGRAVTLRGRRADLLGWATGRPAGPVLRDGDPAPAAPRWI
ncbi:maleylpyruvate isomerase family mycothiol-dependent enzyme [Nakamurella leprariae]|uniref:Maleylpyruvate isomerase family mycothiol-dependent enzyme n=1 Tax=Nakamurella leprariae TaxID=2803911 RepID=A0A938YCJ6_9ACTN|nr:maleylpyruvate isomerase family mycothiol-dependent enzyme [Nakamurella leprariae]MBM9468137.1 maleylpyruvate isomerase family mycothiol-dependent enzyme [Nakamurella leprariae]